LRQQRKKTEDWSTMVAASHPIGTSGRESATVAFVDLAGFSAITDVYGDQAAIRLLEVFERLVSEALAGHAPPIKWIGDEAMLAFSDPATALNSSAGCCRHAEPNRGCR
jgi:class 3 adenylate cyclase